MTARSSKNVLRGEVAPLRAPKARTVSVLDAPLRGAWLACLIALAGLWGACDELDTAGEDSPDTEIPDAGDTDAPDEHPIEEPPDIDFTGLEPVTPRFDHSAGGFFDTPWPSDHRRFPDGSPDLSNFPNTATVTLIREYRAAMEHILDGFSTMPVVYVSYDDAPSFEDLPTPAETLASDGRIQLVELGERCGHRVPVEVTFSLEGDKYTDPHTLRIAPVPGFVLRPSTTYALVILRTFGDADGLTSAFAPGIEALLAGEHEDAALNEIYAPLRDCLRQASLFPTLTSVATVFTTQDPVRETRLMRDAVLDPDYTQAPQVTSWAQSEQHTTTSYTTYLGMYRGPIFQSGEPPYATSGGALEFDEDGRPVIHRYEEIPFSISWPRSGEAPFPIMVWVDGTGASQTSHLGRQPFMQALAKGFAVANFQPQFHSGRSGPGADDVLHTFNYLNPTSGRTVFRQQAAETSYFLRVLREAAPVLPDLPELDTTNMVYGGHSQGALVGAMVAGLETEFKGYFLNGVGAYLSVTVVERKDPFDIAQLVSRLLSTGGPIDRFHPVVQLAQLGGDAVDPHNYAIYWRGWEEHPAGNHLLMTNGDVDDTTHLVSINALTIAGDTAPMEPVGWDVDPFGVWDREPEPQPLRGNRTALDGSELTLGSYLRADSGHFTIYRFPETMQMGANFWREALDGVPSAMIP